MKRGGNKPRVPRVRLTHFEVRRGSRLRLRIAIADDAIAAVGAELGALFAKIAPGAIAASLAAEAPSPAAPGAITVVSALPPEDIGIAPEHANDDAAYHESLRARFAEMFGSLCDASLTDALEIACEERARRVDGGN